jgi:SOS-response transcriptional repressor LexA
MSFQHINTVIAQPQQKRHALVPVRRNSHRKGRCEAGFWQPVSRQQANAVLAAARRFDRKNRQPGKHIGPLGPIAIEVLELLVSLVDFRTGRLEPSIQTMMTRLNRSKEAIVRSMKNLQRHGFIDWLRRYEPTGMDGRGPQLRQTSNAYRLCLPKAALRLLGFFGKPAPVPDDFSHEQDTRQTQTEASLAALPLDTWAKAIAPDDLIARNLARFARLIEQRESHVRSETEIHMNYGA